MAVFLDCRVVQCCSKAWRYNPQMILNKLSEEITLYLKHLKLHQTHSVVLNKEHRFEMTNCVAIHKLQHPTISAEAFLTFHQTADVPVL